VVNGQMSPVLQNLRESIYMERGVRGRFQSVEAIPQESPLLRRTAKGEILFFYLAILPLATSSVLTREDQGIQKPIYFTSRAF
jgi:hypothetical protein